MLTQSRTAYIGVITFVSVVWIQSKRNLVGLIIAVLFLGLVWAFAPGNVKDRFLSITRISELISVGAVDFEDEE